MNLRETDHQLLADSYATQGIHESQQVEKSEHDRDDNDNVQDAFNLAIHWHVVIDQPQQDSNNDQSDHERD